VTAGHLGGAIGDRDAGGAASIELHGLAKSFPGPDGPIEAVRGIDVEIAAGETLALLGPNGAGKSTTLDMLLGLLAPDGGTVSVFGRSPSEAVAQGAVGAMLQSGALIRDPSVRELVAMIASLLGHLGPALLHGRTGVVRHDGRDALVRRSHRGRARRRMESPAAHHAASWRSCRLPRWGSCSVTC
jgi:ABC-type branched-subunit amino acid transport system ATPase component